MPPELYAPPQKRRARAAKIDPSGPASRGRAGSSWATSPWLERMRHPLATPIRLVRHDARRLVVEARPNWSLVLLSVAFFVAAYVFGFWALINGTVGASVVDGFLVGVMVLVMLHLAVRYLLAPLGGEQIFAFDKPQGLLTVTTKGMLKDRVDRYRLRDVVKLHVNRVDDGIYDPSTLLVIFKGGGTLQFPAHPGVPARVEALAEALGRFLAVSRSDEYAATRVVPAAPPAAPVMDLDELALEGWLAQHGPSGLTR